MGCGNYYAAVVIYNQYCKDSITCKNLKDICKTESDIKIIIADNSTQEKIKKANRLQCEEYQWEYRDMEGNKGLSVAYNRIIEKLPRLNNEDCIIWFDDDTDITGEYFQELRKCINENPKAEIFVPVIRGLDGKIYSPNERGFFRNHFIKSRNELIRNKYFNAINSCMAVKTKIYENYHYDEKLFMDMVDQKFCLDMSEVNKKFAIINVEVVQNFFQRSNNLTVEKVWTRYNIRIRDFMNYANTDVFHRWLGVVKVALWGIDMAIRCKTLKIFFMCIHKSIEYAVELSKSTKKKQGE